MSAEESKITASVPPVYASVADIFHKERESDVVDSDGKIYRIRALTAIEFSEIDKVVKKHGSNTYFIFGVVWKGLKMPQISFDDAKKINLKTLLFLNEKILDISDMSADRLQKVEEETENL